MPDRAPDRAMVELTLDYHLMLNRGLVRERNEDRCGAFVPEEPALRQERGRLFIVADGMGGHAAGDVAAETAVKSVQASYFRDAWQGPAAQLRAAFVTANQAILAAASDRDHQGMGAAAVAAAIVQQRVFVAHLGDCRGYLVRDARAARLTIDHSWVQERVSAGRLTVDEAQDHPYRNVLTRALGSETRPEPDVGEAALVLGDTLLLCSDGLWGLADDDALAQTINAAPDAAAAAQALVDLALARGGYDNISVIVVRVAGPASEAPTVKLRRDGDRR